MTPPSLLSPLELRGRRLRNRIVFGPHETNLAYRRAISRRHVAYYTRRARGGVALLVTENASVHDVDWPYERAPLAADCEAGWRAVGEACHPEGTVVLAGLSHAGGQGSSAYSQRELWGPSNVPDVASREVPKAMEPEDVATVVDVFAAAAALARRCGLDGVEINAGQHSLIRQFLSGLTNLREDGYGERPRLAREVLSAVRAAVPDGIVGLRLSCDELAPWAGITPEQAGHLAVELSDAVDYLAVVRGSAMATAATRPDGHTPPGFNVDLAAGIRDALHDGGLGRVAVLAQGSIVDPDAAAAVLSSGAADLVEMTRALLADANLPRKLTTGEAARVRPCILCNQNCMVRDPRNPIVSCAVDPRTGHEWDQPTVMDVPPVSRTVAVVGGGPAGLEAARVARVRGHTVRLLEGSGRLGGQLRLAAAGAGRERLGRIVDWLVAECEALGVRVELDTVVDADALRTSGDDVILATGSQDGERTFAVAPGAETMLRSASAVLDAIGSRDSSGVEPALPDGPTVIWDPIGGPIAISIAETLVSPERPVTLVTPDPVAGNELSRSGDLAPANNRLQAAGVVLVKHTALRAARPGSVTVEHRLTGQQREMPAALVVDAGFRLPNEDLWRCLAEDTLRVGDEVAPRTVYEALLEARRAVTELDARPMPRRPGAGVVRPAAVTAGGRAHLGATTVLEDVSR